MGEWIVGGEELLSADWVLNDIDTTTGSATVEITTVVSGAVRYLATDLTTLTTTPTQIPLTFDSANKWSRILVVPASLKNKNVYVQYTHSNSLLPPIAEEDYYVTVHDLDDAVAASAGSGNPGASVEV